jgi:hypothetical protein
MVVFYRLLWGDAHRRYVWWIGVQTGERRYSELHGNVGCRYVVKYIHKFKCILLSL